MPEFDVPTLVENSPGPPAGAAPGVDAGVFSGMEDNLRGKMVAQEGVFKQQEGAFAKRTAQMEQAFNASGVEAQKLQPWDAKQKEEEFYHNPIEAFGSLGSVFGIIASAFTHAPMENALNASAGAMNAIREGDEKSYKNAYDAWKQNMELVVKRHNMQRDLFQDAFSLLKVDMSAGEAKLKNIATRFGDQQTLTMLEAGLGTDEIWKLQEARNKSAQGLMKTNEMITEKTLRDQVFKADDAANADIQDPMLKAAHRLELFNRVYGVKQTSEQEIMGKWFFEHPQGTAEEAAKFRNENFGYGSRPETPETAIIQALKDEHTAAGKDPPTANEIADALRRAKASGAAGGNANLTTDRQRAQDVAAYREELKNAKNEDGSPKYNATQIGDMAAQREKELKTKASAPSGNQLDNIQSRIDRSGFMLKTIDKIEELLVKHKGLAGLGGKVSRPAEAVGNIFGSNETDRRQFERWILELQEWGPRIINDANGRPLSAEASKIEGIVAGLRAGDTTANTVRAYRELKELLNSEIIPKLQQRKSGGIAPPVAAPSAPANPKTAPWSRDPVTRPRAEIEPDEAAG